MALPSGGTGTGNTIHQLNRSLAGKFVPLPVATWWQHFRCNWSVAIVTGKYRLQRILQVNQCLGEMDCSGLKRNKIAY
jgi:hypothetical protein